MNKKDAYYFSHDSNSRNDVKIIKLRREMGMEGYGIFWCLIEILRESSDYKISLSSVDDISFNIHVNSQKIMKIIKEYSLFEIVDNCFCSPRLCNSMNEYNTLKMKLQEAGRKGGYSRAKAYSKRGHGIKGNKSKENKNVIFPSEMIL